MSDTIYFGYDDGIALQVTSFYGGHGRGRMLQIDATIAQLGPNEVKALVDKLNGWLWRVENGSRIESP